ncbi:hypothetical protein LTR33_005890 [Friedmanniomyces endolithicus]|nr:hypothetical protein LTR33_005890 [Friedmanniomyces endolithicus]
MTQTYADEASNSVSLQDLTDRVSTDSATSEALAHLLSDSASTSSNASLSNPPDLPPVDGGPGAWTCLLGCWLVEAMIWGFPLAVGVFQRHYASHPQFRPHSALIPSIGTLATGGAVYGVGWVVCYTPLLFMLNEWFVERRGLAYGVLFGASGVSGVVIPVAVGWMLERWGFRVALRIYAGVTVVVSGPGLLLIRPRGSAPGGVARTTQRASLNAVQALRPFATNIHFHIMAAAVFVQGLGFFIPNIYISSFAEGLGLSTSAGSGLLALVSLAQVLGQLGQGLVSDRVNIYIPLAISALIPGLSALLLWGPAKGLAYLAPFAITWGLFSASYSVLYTRMCSFLTDTIDDGTDDHDNVSMLLYGFFSFERGV